MKTALFFLMMILGSSVFAQMNDGKFGNEWIDYSKTYYKFKISEDGIYRIPATHLQLSGVDMSRLNENSVQIFHKGQEIPVHVQMNGAVVDYLEFYASKNRGILDAELYTNGQFNPEYSLISDSAAYFLSLGSNGKRYQNLNANLNNLPQKEAFFMSRAVAMPTLTWNAGKTYNIAGAQFSKSSFEYGEGFGGSLLTTQNISINTPNSYNGTAVAELRMYSEGASHNLLIRANGQNAYNNVFYADSIMTHRFAFSGIQPTTTFTVIGAAGAADKHSIAYAAIEYARSFNFGNSTYFKFDVSAGARKFLEISNFAVSSQVYLFDLTNGIRINCFYDASSGKVLTDLPASAVNRELVLISEGYKTVGLLKSVTFNNYSNYNADFAIIASDRVMNYNGTNPVLEYAAYRASTGYSPVIVNVQEIFDQFGYGTDLHPQALRNFSDYIQQNWEKAKYVFLIGKGKEYNEIRNFNTYDIQIPSFGYPASDNLLFTKKGEMVPALSVGRLSVINGEELSAYLTKVKEMEALKNSASAEAKAWEKNIIHMGGGVNDMEAQMFSNVLNNMKTNVENGKMGAEVASFFKDKSNKDDLGSHITLDSAISKGASIMTYLGHATEESFEYNAYIVNNYNNAKKYPLFISLSCSSGSLFNSTDETSEKLVLTPNKGASAYIGFTQPVSLFSANVYGSEIYRLLSEEGSSLSNGELNRLAMNRLIGSGILNELAANYLIYHGDPALTISKATNADYTAADMKAVFNNETDNFDINLNLFNLGTVTNEIVKVNLYRVYPNKDTMFVATQNLSIKNNKNISFSVRNNGLSEMGLNTFFVRIDEMNELVEMSEKNNSLVLTVTLGAKQINRIYPADFAMLADNNITFMAANADVFAAEKTYRLEIDTTPVFNNVLVDETVSAKGAMISFAPQYSFQDSVVYYWRVTEGENNDGDYSSFVVIPGKTGFNQSHSYQFGKNSYSTLRQTAQGFEYNSKKHELSVVNALTPSVLAPGFVASFFNNNLIEKCRCQNENGVYVLVMDQNRNFWTVAGTTQYGAVNCDPSRATNLFLFETANPAKQEALEQFLRDSVPAGHYVMMYTLNDAKINTWSESLVSLLGTYGSSAIANLSAEQTVKPWAFFFEKGQNNSREAVANSSNDIITLKAEIIEK
jgi:hypothetical protein